MRANASITAEPEPQSIARALMQLLGDQAKRECSRSGASSFAAKEVIAQELIERHGRLDPFEDDGVAFAVVDRETR